MRELKTLDVFKMSKILSKVDVKIDAEGKTADQLGTEIILKIGMNLHLVEVEVNEFMGSMIGCTPKEFSELPLEKTLEHLEDFKKLSGIQAFFKSAGRLTKQM